MPPRSSCCPSQSLKRDAAYSMCLLEMTTGKGLMCTCLMIPLSRICRFLCLHMGVDGPTATRSGWDSWRLAIVSLPAIFVSLSYRLAPASRYPEPMEDCFSAVEWVYKNIKNFGGSPNRIFIGGHSAGGHLASLVALRKDLTEARGLPSNVIKGCFPVSTPFDMRADNPEAGSDEESLRLLLKRLEDGEDASPICHVAGNRTPFLIVCGSRDLEWVLRTTPQMVAALRGQPGGVESFVFEGLDHYETNLDQRYESNPWVKKVREWMSNF